MPTNKQKRSKFLDYFLNSSRNNETNNNNKKEKIKRIWQMAFKIVKIISFIFLFTIALTACVQVLALKTGRVPGSGLEFYLNKQDVSPVVKTFKYDEESKIYQIDNSDIKYIHRDHTKALMKQSEEDHSSYGEGYSSSIVFKEEVEFVKGNSIVAPYQENGRYLFRYQPTNEQIELNMQKNEVASYTPLNNLKNVLGYKLEDYLVPSYKIKEIVGQKTVNYVKDPSRNGIVTYKEDNLRKIKDIHFAKLGLANPRDFDEIYARDVLATLLKKTFTQKYYVEALKEVNEKSVVSFINNLVTYDEEKDNYVPRDRELSDAEKVLLDSYIKVVTSYIRLLGFQINLNDVAPYKAPLFFNIAALKDSIYNAEYQKVFSTWLEAWKIDHFHALVGYPLTAMMAAISDQLPYAAGWTSILVIIIAVIVARLVSLIITRKSLFSQQKQQELTPKKAKIEAKYANYKGNKMMENRKRMEIQDLYKKNGLNLFSPFLMMVVSMPIFLAMYRGINSLPELKATTWLGITFSATSVSNLFTHGEWVYLPVLILTLSIQAISLLLPMILTAKRNKERTNLIEKQQIRKQNRMQYIFIGVFSLFAIAINAGVQIYWIFGGIWTIVQTLIIHYIIVSKWYKRKQELRKLKSQEIEI